MRSALAYFLSKNMKVIYKDAVFSVCVLAKVKPYFTP